MILANATTAKALWYLARGTGLVCLVLLTIVMVLGITQVQQWARPGWPRFVTALLHRNVSLLVVVFLMIHIASSVVDGFAGIGWLAAVVPGATSYRPIWLGLGACAFDLLLALVATSLLRQRLGHRAWRAVHWLAYLSWPIAFLHGLGTGTDGRVGWVQALDATCLVLVLAAITWRLVSGWNLEPAARATGAAVGTLAVVGIVAWAAVGPTQPGWARRAGTPARLLAPATTAPAGATGGTTAPVAAIAFPALPFNAPLTGHATTTGSTAATVDIEATISGAPANSGLVSVVLHGRGLAGGGLHLADGRFTMGTTVDRALYAGPVSSLAGARIEATVTGPAGARAAITLQVTIDPATGAVTGSISAGPA